MSVPSNKNDPSIMETNPSADFVFESDVVNVRASPTSYLLPTSSITISLTRPALIVSIFAVANPLPILVFVSNSIS